MENFWKNGRSSGRVWPDGGKYCMGGYSWIGLCRVKDRERQFAADLGKL